MNLVRVVLSSPDEPRPRSGHPSSGQVPPHQSDKYCNCTVRSVEEILATGQAEPGQESDLPDSINQRLRDNEWKAFLEGHSLHNTDKIWEQDYKELGVDSPGTPSRFKLTFWFWLSSLAAGVFNLTPENDAALPLLLLKTHTVQDTAHLYSFH